MNKNSKGRKRQQKILLTGIVLVIVFATFFVCKKEKNEYVSMVAKADCVICRERTGVHSGENNLGIINLHDGTVHYVRINRYDKKGKPKVETDGYLQVSSLYPEETIKIDIEADADRGYADVDIMFYKEAQIDYDKVLKTCCQECLDAVLQRKEIDKQQFGIAVINYKNSELKVLSKNLKAFMNEDYYVNCEVRKSKMGLKTKKLELLVFYCPVRG